MLNWRTRQRRTGWLTVLCLVIQLLSVWATTLPPPCPQPSEMQCARRFLSTGKCSSNRAKTLSQWKDSSSGDREKDGNAKIPTIVLLTLMTSELSRVRCTQGKCKRTLGDKMRPPTRRRREALPQCELWLQEGRRSACSPLVLVDEGVSTTLEVWVKYSSQSLPWAQVLILLYLEVRLAC